MLRFVNIIKIRFATTIFKVDSFTKHDYQTISKLLKQKLPIYNQQMKIYSDIRLLDQSNKLLGIYSPPQARKKASNLKKDIILVKADATPPLCKLSSFRQNTLSNFYDQIIRQRNEQLINRASTMKNLRLKITLNEDQLKIKGRQISELAKKHSKIRVYMICKQQMIDEGLSKLQFLKSQLQNNCKILEEANLNTVDQEEEQQKVGNNHTLSLVLKSTQNEFLQLLEESSKQSPEEAISYFLKRYYKQQDVQMRDLKNQADYTSLEDIYAKLDQITNNSEKKKKNKDEKNLLPPKILESKFKVPPQQKYIYQINERKNQAAIAKIANDRLKRIVELAQQI